MGTVGVARRGWPKGVCTRGLQIGISSDSSISVYEPRQRLEMSAILHDEEVRYATQKLNFGARDVLDR